MNELSNEHFDETNFTFIPSVANSLKWMTKIFSDE